MTPEIQRKYAHLVLETTPGPHNHMMAELAALHRQPRIIGVDFSLLGDWSAPSWPEFVERAERAYVESVLTGTGFYVMPPLPQEDAK